MIQAETSPSTRAFLRRQEVQELARAEYYTWQALRGQTLPGNDPMTGKKRDRFHDATGTEESRAAYIAMAKTAIRRAQAHRIAAGGGR